MRALVPFLALLLVVPFAVLSTAQTLEVWQPCQCTPLTGSGLVGDLDDPPLLYSRNATHLGLQLRTDDHPFPSSGNGSGQSWLILLRDGSVIDELGLDEGTIWVNPTGDQQGGGEGEEQGITWNGPIPLLSPAATTFSGDPDWQLSAWFPISELNVDLTAVEFGLRGIGQEGQDPLLWVPGSGLGDSSPPALQFDYPGADGVVTQGQSLLLTASDETLAQVAYSLDGAPAVDVAVVSSTMIVPVTSFALTSGLHTISLTAVDQWNLATTQIWNFSVTVNQPPVLQIPMMDLTLSDLAVQIDLSGWASDPEGDSLTWSLGSSAPLSSQVLGNVLEIIPDLAGLHSIDLAVEDAKGLSAVGVFIAQVQEPNQVPVWIPLNDLELGLSETVTLSLIDQIWDEEPTLLSFSASSGGQVADTSVGAGQLQITAVEVGSITIDLVASDAGGLSAATSLDLSVHSEPITQPPPPVTTLEIITPPQIFAGIETTIQVVGAVGPNHWSIGGTSWVGSEIENVRFSTGSHLVEVTDATGARGTTELEA